MNLHLNGNLPAAGFYFSVEIGPNPEGVDEFVKRVFYALGLTTPDRIRAYDKYTERFNIKTYSLDISIGWVWGDDLGQQQPHLMYEQEKLLWNVSFSPLKDGLPVRGGNLCILIDDKTGEVVKSVIGIR